jgi:hypothetical protein
MLPIVSVVGNIANTISFNAKKYAPQIAIFSGIGLGVSGVVAACVATRRLDGILDDTKKELSDIHDKSVVDPEHKEYTEDQIKKDTFKVYAKTTGKVINNYKWAIGMEAASILLILVGSKTLNERYVRTAVALAGMTADFNDYREEVRNRYGDEVDKQIRYGYKTEEIKEKVTDENGKTKTVKKTVNVLPDGVRNNQNDYVRIFDWTNPWWDDGDIGYNLTFLRAQQSYFNNLLIANKHVFLNDVLKALGYPPTRVGQEVGWNYNPDSENDGYIDFRITESYVTDDYGSRRKVILLDFNVDGSILNKVDWPDRV